MMYPGVMPDYMGWMMFGSYLFWFAIIAVAVFFVVRMTRPADRQSNARSILEERFARGEINEEEFRARLALVRGSAG